MKKLNTKNALLLLCGWADGYSVDVKCVVMYGVYMAWDYQWEKGMLVSRENVHFMDKPFSIFRSNIRA